ncbi:MAG: ATP-binding protein [Pyrinomonadaceae bacterium]|nr:ATP-binding protein [Pyrinomonadaceae bacterium]
MQRKILIIDDHDDLASALKNVFEKSGHQVKALETRAEAVCLDDIENFDLVITDLDGENLFCESNQNGNSADCLPHISSASLNLDEPIKAFKICATNFRRDEFDENELKNFVETILNYKIQFVDTTEFIQNLHEKIEFELPSTVSTMHAVLNYLMKRVEKLGVINPEQSNLFIALDEAFVNAVKHGNKFDANKLVRITADVSSKEARFTVEDEGEGFDVNAIPDPLDPTNLFKTSGRGVLFIYNIMDEVKYNERGNRLTMVKKSDNTEKV